MWDWREEERQEEEGEMPGNRREDKRKKQGRKREGGRRKKKGREGEEESVCLTFPGNLVFKPLPGGKDNHITKMVANQASHLSEQIKSLRPLIDADPAVKALNKKIVNMEKKIALLEAENAKLKGLDANKHEPTSSSKRKRREAGASVPVDKDKKSSSRKKKEGGSSHKRDEK
jgi:hypothetical protein